MRLKPSPGEEVAMGNIESTASSLHQRYCAAVGDKDVSAFMRLYDPLVQVFDAWGEWQYDGAASWQKSVEGWFSSLGDEGVKVTFDETRCYGTLEGAISSSIVTYAAVSSTGEVLRSMQNRLTWGLRFDGQELVVIHEHTSAPIGFEDMKAILQKGPDS